MKKLFLFLALLCGVVSMRAMEDLKKRYPKGTVLGLFNSWGPEGIARALADPRMSEQKKQQLKTHGGLTSRVVVTGDYYSAPTRVAVRYEDGTVGYFHPQS